MESVIQRLLEEVDDTEHPEFPLAFDRSAFRKRLVALQPELERIAGRKFLVFEAQDASFFGDLTIQCSGLKPNWIDTVFALRFSNFGNLFTIWSDCDAERLPEAIVTKLVATTEQAGFRFVPESALNEPYTGRHPGLQGVNWGIRFFDYL